MNELNDLIDDFLNELDRDNRIKSLKKSYKNIKKDKILIDYFKKYNENPYNETLKDKLSNSKKIIDAHKYEGDCNYIILAINNELKIFKNKGRCI